jgi:hypothetical protein
VSLATLERNAHWLSGRVVSGTTYGDTGRNSLPPQRALAIVVRGCPVGRQPSALPTLLTCRQRFGVRDSNGHERRTAALPLTVIRAMTRLESGPHEHLVTVVGDAVREVLGVDREVVGMSYSADSAFISRLGIPTVLLGPSGGRARRGRVGQHLRDHRLRRRALRGWEGSCVASRRLQPLRSTFGVRDSNGHERRAHGGLALDSHTRLKTHLMMRPYADERTFSGSSWTVVRPGGA